MSTPSTSQEPAHLLIVDDRVDELRLLIELLREQNYRLSVAFDGAQAYQRAQARAPDLILMDVRMPGTDGFTACRLLKSDPATAHIPIIFLTSSSDLDERLEGLHNGAVDYVIKPFEPAEVLARIRIHLAHVPREQVKTLPALSAPVSDRDQIIVKAAMQYLSGCLAHPPRLAQLAQKLGTHEKRLSRAFRTQLGKTVFEFVRDERLQSAQRMLTETGLSVTSIAEEIGFSSVANFATAFREHIGTTPSAYREQTRQLSASACPPRT